MVTTGIGGGSSGSGGSVNVNELTLIDSTTTALGASAEWISNTGDCNGYKNIVGSVYADQDGTLYIEQSGDETNWDVESVFNYTAGDKMGFSVEVVARYVRIRFVNGATAQSTFRLYAYLRKI